MSQHHGRAVAFSHFKDRQAGTKTQSRHGVDVGARLTAALHPYSRVGAVPMTRQPRTGSILPLLGPSLFAGHYRRESAGADKRRLPGFYKWTTCTSYLVNDSPERRFRLAGTSLRFSCANVSYWVPARTGSAVQDVPLSKTHHATQTVTSFASLGVAVYHCSRRGALRCVNEERFVDHNTSRSQSRGA